MLLQWVLRLKSDICRCFKFLGHFAEDSSSQINVSWSEDKAFTKRWCWLSRNGCRCAFHFTLEILPQVLPQQRGHEWMTVKVWDWYTRFISDIKYDWWLKLLHWVREFTSFKVWRCSTGFGRKNWQTRWNNHLLHHIRFTKGELRKRMTFVYNPTVWHPNWSKLDAVTATMACTTFTFVDYRYLCQSQRFFCRLNDL